MLCFTLVPYLPLVGMLIAGVTHMVFPAQWKSLWIRFSMTSFMRDLWEEQNLFVFRILGCIVSFIAICGIVSI